MAHQQETHTAGKTAMTTQGHSRGTLGSVPSGFCIPSTLRGRSTSVALPCPSLPLPRAKQRNEKIGEREREKRGQRRHRARRPQMNQENPKTYMCEYEN